MTKDYSTTDYNAKLAQDYADIRAKVRGGMLPLVARIPAIDKAVSAYVLAQDAHYEELRRKAVAEGGDASTAVPIQLRDATALHRMADLVLHEELTWSHPDKMSIVEYPVMSGWQKAERNSKQVLPGEITFRDRHHNGRRKTHSVGKNGEVSVSNPKMPDKDDSDMTLIESNIDVMSLIEGANLTDRQRLAIDLVYFEDMTQERAGEVMGVNKSNVNEYIKHGLAKIRRNMRETS